VISDAETEEVVQGVPTEQRRTLARRAAAVSNNLYCTTPLQARTPCRIASIPPQTCDPACCLQNLPSVDGNPSGNASCFNPRSSPPSPTDADLVLTPIDPTLFTATSYESLIMSDPGFESWSDPFMALSDESRVSICFLLIRALDVCSDVTLACIL
jgi:hypothetical protein